jgi:hypothetical protein
MVALVVEKNPLMPPCCTRVAAFIKLFGCIAGTILSTNPAHRRHDYFYQCSMSKMKNVKGIHPFGGEESPAFKKFIVMVQRHPRIKKKECPTWLQEYYVVDFVGEEESNDVSHLVHSLYHSIFDEYSDRQSMLPALRKGETIAVLNRKKAEAVCAITFLAQNEWAVVLFLGTISNHTSYGMASFMLSLVYEVLRVRMGKATIHMYLKANKRQNHNAFHFYVNRGFREKHERIPFPSALKDAFSNEVDTSLLHNYLGYSQDLTWLHGTFGSTSFFKYKNDAVNTRFFSNPNPNEMDEHSTNARLPGRLCLDDVEHCAPDIKLSGAAAVLKNKVFYGGKTLGNVEASVCWLSRCWSTAYQNFPVDVYEVIIAWVQRHQKAKIWREMLSIIPLDIMRNVSTMQVLFSLYCSALRMIETNNGHNVETSFSTFHPQIDYKRFMEASIPVLRYVLQNKNLFINPYIAVMVEHDVDSSWSCFMSVNAGKIDKKRGTECGFLHFDPTDNDCAAPAQCSFFLTFAYLIIKAVPTKVGEKRSAKATSWKDEVIAPWFQTMEEFHDLYTTADFNFGYTLNVKDKDDVKHGRFLCFKVPYAYRVLLEQKGKLQNKSGILAFISLLDFCLLLESINFKHDKNEVSLSGMGVSIPDQKAKLTAFLKGMRLCIFQVIDRIACTQMGSSREEATEYQKFIIPTNKDHREIKMPFFVRRW